MRRRVLVALVMCGCGTRSGLAVGDVEDAGRDAQIATACVPKVDLPAPSTPPTPHADCLADTSGFDANWKLDDPSWCIVARYDLPRDEQFFTWGNHGGPLSGADPIVRWKAPSGATGTLTYEETKLDTALPPSVGAGAVDLPFDDETAIPIDSSRLGDPGQIWLVTRDGHVEGRIDTHSVYSLVGLAEAGRTRLLVADESYSGASPPYAFRILAFDGCAAGTCATPVTFDAPSLYNVTGRGAVADPDGNVFFGYLEGRGAPGDFLRVDAYERSHIAPGACPTDGRALETSGKLTPAADGRRLFVGANDFERGVEVIPYRSDGDEIVFEKQTSFIAPASDARGGYFSSLFIDDQRRLWALDALTKPPIFWVISPR